MAAEINFAKAQIEEYQLEMQDKSKEIQDLKEKFYTVKKQEQQLREKERARTLQARQAQTQPIPSGPRFVGGGFSLNHP